MEFPWMEPSKLLYRRKAVLPVPLTPYPFLIVSFQTSKSNEAINIRRPQSFLSLLPANFIICVYQNMWAFPDIPLLIMDVISGRPLSIYPYFPDSPRSPRPPFVQVTPDGVRVRSPNCGCRPMGILVSLYFRWQSHITVAALRQIWIKVEHFAFSRMQSTKEPKRSLV